MPSNQIGKCHKITTIVTFDHKLSSSSSFPAWNPITGRPIFSRSIDTKKRN